MGKGKLYLVATPIGNLEDMSFRALRVLKEVDLIACEDTRRTRQLCNYYQVTTPLISYHQHNERDRTLSLLEKLKNGQDIAVVSDAGTPAISDPGAVIVRAAMAEKIGAVPVPGPSAFLAALTASGLDTTRFLFAGFLPRKESLRHKLLKEWQYCPETLIFYVSPHRYAAVINDLAECLGADRDVVVARELTKLHETFIRGKLGSELVLNCQPKGEVCLVISGSQTIAKQYQANPLNDLTMEQHFEFYVNNGIERKTALKKVAQDRGLKRNEVYKRLKTEH